MDSETNTVIVSKPHNGLAKASCVLGILSILTMGVLGIGALAGLILGILALGKTNHDPEKYGGKSLAIVGITTSVVSFFTSTVATILLVMFVVQPVKVEGMGMSPTLNAGDKIFIGKQFNEINRNDIVIFWFPDNPSQSFIKRIVGLPGETIRMDEGGQLSIDGQFTEQPYLSPEKNRSPRRIPETYIRPHYYFVMGDNRDGSNDSRSWGLVPEKYIYGKFWRRYYSAN
jgi:signal peptidase I